MRIYIDQRPSETGIRGYDSAGIAIYNTSLKNYRKKGKVSELEAFVVTKTLRGMWGLDIPLGDSRRTMISMLPHTSLTVILLWL
jgi:glutamine phosphoribosylpyrophosphate amidotransferase